MPTKAKQKSSPKKKPVAKKKVSARTGSAHAGPSPKQRFLDTYKREHATTIKVLRAFPESQAAYRPHERSNSALQLAWTFVVENNMAHMALQGPLKLGGGFPPAPATIGEVIAAYEGSAKQLIDALGKTRDSRLTETVDFPSGPGTMAAYAVHDFLWFMLMDSIHHRGQMSVYLRCAGGKVPSIYGPSADEPWR